MIYKEISEEDYFKLQDRTGAYLVLSPSGTKQWWLNGHFHREDGPAVEWSDGDKEWYFDGDCHREDGPAIKWAEEDKEWWLNGFLHREDGPAIEWADGAKSWWLHGKKYKTEEEWRVALDELRAKEIKDLIV